MHEERASRAGSSYITADVSGDIFAVMALVLYFARPPFPTKTADPRRLMARLGRANQRDVICAIKQRRRRDIDLYISRPVLIGRACVM